MCAYICKVHIYTYMKYICTTFMCGILGSFIFGLTVKEVGNEKLVRFDILKY